MPPPILLKAGCVWQDVLVSGTKPRLTWLQAMAAVVGGGSVVFVPTRALAEEHLKKVYAARLDGWIVKAASDENDKRFLRPEEKAVLALKESEKPSVCMQISFPQVLRISLFLVIATWECVAAHCDFWKRCVRSPAALVQTTG